MVLLCRHLDDITLRDTFKVGHMGACQKNPVPGLEVRGTTKWTFCCLPSRWAPGSIKQADMGLDAQGRHAPKLDILFVHLLRCKITTRPALPVSKRNRDCRWLWGRFPGGRPAHCWQAGYPGLMPLTLGLINES